MLPDKTAHSGSQAETRLFCSLCRLVGVGFCLQKCVWLPLAASQTLCLPHHMVGKSGCCISSSLYLFSEKYDKDQAQGMPWAWPLSHQKPV